MNDEIKEIIEHIKTYPEKMYCLSEKEKIRILDYITNLQQLYENGLKVNQNSHKYITELEMNNAILKQENERLKEENILLKASEPMSKIAEDYGYKSRCEKTINAINILQEIIYQQPTENGADDMWLLDKLDGFKNILDGSDDK